MDRAEAKSCWSSIFRVMFGSIYHRLHSSKDSTPYRIDTRHPIAKKFVMDDYVGDLYSCAIFGANLSTGSAFCLTNGWCITILFIYLFVCHWANLPTGKTCRRMFVLMAQMMRTHARMCLFGVSLILLPTLEVKFLQKTNFGSMNRRFQAKCPKYHQNNCIDCN